MKFYQVELNSIDSVKRFVDATTAVQCEVDVLSGRYVVDGKSIMALFSIDLNKPVTVRFHGTDEEGDQFKQEISEFVTIAEIGQVHTEPSSK